MKHRVILIYIIGIAIILFSILWSGIKYPDDSQMFIGMSIGWVVVGFGYIYNYMIEMDNKYKEFQKKFDSLRTYLHSNDIVKFGEELK